MVIWTVVAKPALEMAKKSGKPVIRVMASVSATDTLALADRANILGLDAAVLPVLVMLGFTAGFGALAIARFEWEE